MPYNTKPKHNKKTIPLRSAGFQPCATCANHKNVGLKPYATEKHIHNTKPKPNKNSIPLRSAGFQPCEKCANHKNVGLKPYATEKYTYQQ